MVEVFAFVRENQQLNKPGKKLHFLSLVGTVRGLDFCDPMQYFVIQAECEEHYYRIVDDGKFP